MGTTSTTKRTGRKSFVNGGRRSEPFNVKSKIFLRDDKDKDTLVLLDKEARTGRVVEIIEILEPRSNSGLHKKKRLLLCNSEGMKSHGKGTKKRHFQVYKFYPIPG